MAKHRKKLAFDIIPLGRSFGYITEWQTDRHGKIQYDRQGRPIPKEWEVAPAGNYLVAEGVGERQDIYHIDHAEYQEFELEDDIAADVEVRRGGANPRRGAAALYGPRDGRSEQDDPRRDGYREPRQDDHPRSMWRDSGPVATTRMPVPVHPADSWPVEPYAMPTRKPLTVFDIGDAEKSSA